MHCLELQMFQLFQKSPIYILFQLHYLKILRLIMKLIQHLAPFTKRFRKKSWYQSWKKRKLFIYSHCLSIRTNACFMKTNCTYHEKCQECSETFSRFEKIWIFWLGKALNKLKSYHWKNKTRDVKKYVRGCREYQSSKDSRSKRLVNLNHYKSRTGDGDLLQQILLPIFQRLKMGIMLSWHLSISLRKEYIIFPKKALMMQLKQKNLSSKCISTTSNTRFYRFRSRSEIDFKILVWISKSLWYWIEDVECIPSTNRWFVWNHEQNAWKLSKMFL